jgi:hypothetical protein
MNVHAGFQVLTAVVMIFYDNDIIRPMSTDVSEAHVADVFRSEK